MNAVNDGGVLQRALLGYVLCANVNLLDCTQALPKNARPLQVLAFSAPVLY